MDLLFDRGFPVHKAHRLALEEWHKQTSQIPVDDKNQVIVDEKEVA